MAKNVHLLAVTARCTLEKKEAVRSGAPAERESERGREKATEVEEEAGEEEAGAEERGSRREEVEEASAEVAMAVAMASTAQPAMRAVGAKTGGFDTHSLSVQIGPLQTQNPLVAVTQYRHCHPKASLSDVALHFCVQHLI